MSGQKVVIGLGLGGVFGVALGFALGIAAFPFLFPPPEVNEQIAGKTEADVVARATFIHADPSDPVHYGKGQATIYADLVRLEENFEVGPGPKFHVYLVPEADIKPGLNVEETMFVDLGRLKAFTGSQNYAVPPGVDPRNYRSVVIWCEQFNVLISPAAISLA